MIQRRIDKKVDEHIGRQIERALPPLQPLPLPVEALAQAAQWTGVVVGAFLQGVRR